MSTNYYAILNRPESTLNVHLGKTTGHSVSLSGLLYASLKDLERFLKHGETYGLRIEAEHGVEYSADEFVRMLRGYGTLDRARQYHSTDKTHNWLDPEGFTFSAYDYC